MTALIIAQTIFYFTVSFAIIVVGVLCAIIAWRIAAITRELEEISREFHEKSGEAYEKLENIIDRLSGLPILSYFLKPKMHHTSGHKGRGHHEGKNNEE